MDNNQSSEIVPNSTNISQNAISSSDRSKSILETQSVSIIKPENNNSFELKKWIVVCTAVVLSVAIFFLFAKGTDICFLSICHDNGGSSATDSTSMGHEFVAYAGGAATLVVLTTLVGIPLLPAVAVSAGVWFFIQMIH